MQHLSAKITQIHSQLDAHLVVGLEEMPGNSLVQFSESRLNLLDLRVWTVSLATCSLDPCLLWLIKGAQRVSCE